MTGDLSIAPIEYFFDFHSPWCYFASLQIGKVAARAGRTVSWRPMHLARLIERIDGRRPLEANPAFVKWFKQDMLDWAADLGVDLKYHPNFPLRPVRALRASVRASQSGRAEEFVQAVMRAYWSESRDISDPLVLGKVGESVGMPRSVVIQSIADPFCKAAVESNTAQAEAIGVFGAPSFICDHKLFWGNDRLEQLERFAKRNRAPDG